MISSPARSPVGRPWVAARGAGSSTPTATRPPDPAQSDPNVPFDVPDPPQGKFAAVTDMNGPGTRILYRDLRLEGRFSLQLSVFYAGTAPFSSPASLAYDTPSPTSSSASTWSAPRPPSTRWTKGDVLANVFHLAGRSGPPPANRGEHGHVGVGGPDGSPAPGHHRQRRVRCGSGWTTSGSAASAGTPTAGWSCWPRPRPSSAVDLVLHRLPQRRRWRRSPTMPPSVPGLMSSPGPCSSPATARSCSRTPGAGPTARPAWPTPRRPGSGSAR